MSMHVSRCSHDLHLLPGQAQPSGGPYVSPGAPANYSADGQAQYSQQPSGYTQSPPSGSAQDDLLMIDFS